MKISVINIISIIGVIVFLLFVNLLRNMDIQRGYPSIQKENNIPRYKKKKCGHLFNNRHCRWCTYYRFHPHDMRFYEAKYGNPQGDQETTK